MERVETDPPRAGTRSAELEARYVDLVEGVDAGDAASLEERARVFDRELAVAGRHHRDPRIQLLRARLAATLAHVLPLDGLPARAHARRALHYARALRGVAGIGAGCADGVVAEAFLALCKHATSTSKRALYFHQGRAAALRALERDPADVSANLALGAFSLHTPRAFGGSVPKAIPFLERVLEKVPTHRGASLLLAEAYFRSDRDEEYGVLLASLRDRAPALARYLCEELLPRMAPEEIQSNDG